MRLTIAELRKEIASLPDDAFVDIFSSEAGADLDARLEIFEFHAENIDNEPVLCISISNVREVAAFLQREVPKQ